MKKCLAYRGIKYLGRKAYNAGRHGYNAGKQAYGAGKTVMDNFLGYVGLAKQVIKTMSEEEIGKLDVDSAKIKAKRLYYEAKNIGCRKEISEVILMHEQRHQQPLIIGDTFHINYKKELAGDKYRFNFFMDPRYMASLEQGKSFSKSANQ